MKKKLLSLLIIPFLTCGSLSAGYTGMDIRLTDGTTTSVELADDLTASFTASDLVVSSSTVSLSIPRGDIESFVFNENSGVRAISTDEVSAPVISGGVMRFSSLPEGSVVSVFSVDGRLVSSDSASGDYELELGRVAADGVFVIRVNNLSYKVKLEKR